MATLINDTELEERLRAERAITGADRFDEVWEGMYVMAPLANDEHQQIVSRLVSIFEETIGWPGLGQVRHGVNVSDRIDDWQQNYRCPDVAVFLRDTTARNHDAFWFGGPDFAVEVVSPGEKSRDKLPFYARVGTRELLVVNRCPWQLELYRAAAGAMKLAGESSPESSLVMRSKVLDFSFQLLADAPRPVIQVVHGATQKSWRV